jgi:hypothetical protein
MELTNIARGPQDPGLFEVPQGTTVISPDTPVDGSDAGAAKGAAAKAPAGDRKD